MSEDYRNAPAHRFARDIAAAMGIEWAYDGAKLNVRQVGYIDGPSGARIGIVLDPWYDDPEMARRDYRVEVIGCYPEVFGEAMRPHKHPSPKITCSPERTPAAIAGDIERRFLPDYWLSLAEAREMAARRSAPEVQTAFTRPHTHTSRHRQHRSSCAKYSLSLR